MKRTRTICIPRPVPAVGTCTCEAGEFPTSMFAVIPSSTEDEEKIQRRWMGPMGQNGALKSYDMVDLEETPLDLAPVGLTTDAFQNAVVLVKERGTNNNYAVSYTTSGGMIALTESQVYLATGMITIAPGMNFNDIAIDTKTSIMYCVQNPQAYDQSSVIYSLRDPAIPEVVAVIPFIGSEELQRMVIAYNPLKDRLEFCVSEGIPEELVSVVRFYSLKPGGTLALVATVEKTVGGHPLCMAVHPVTGLFYVVFDLHTESADAGTQSTLFTFNLDTTVLSQVLTGWEDNRLQSNRYEQFVFDSLTHPVLVHGITFVQ